MRRTWTSVILLAAALAPSAALAGTAEDKVAQDIEYVTMWLPAIRESPASRLHATHASADGCRKAVAAGRKAGLADDARIYTSQVSGWDEAHYDGDRRAYLELGQLRAICDEYAELLLMIPAAAHQEATASSLKTYSTVSPGDLGADMGKTLADDGRSCMAATDQAIAAGAPADRRTLIYGESLTLTEGREQICQAMIDFGNRLAGEIEAAHGAAYEEIAAKYRELGVKGEKLELFVKYDNTYWLGRGCQKVMDLKKQVKAKKLHQRWERPDGTILIRTYTFKGNKVKGVKEKVYRRPEQASRGCK